MTGPGRGELLRAELGKLLRTTPLGWFLLGCLAFNALLIWSGPDARYPAFVGEAASRLGVNVTAAYPEQVEGLTVGSAEQRTRLTADTQAGAAGDFDFDTQDPAKIGETYVRALGAHGTVADLMRAKYAQMTALTAQRATAEQPLTLYFVGDSHDQHQFWFGLLAPALTIQGALLGTAAGLHAGGLEYANRSMALLASTRTGRGVLRPKLAATLLATVAGYLALALVTLGAAGLRYPLAAVWASRVDTPFNYWQDPVVGVRPYFTWLDLTVRDYLFGQIAVAAGLVAGVALVAFALGVVIRNSYLAFGVMAVLAGLLLVAPLGPGANSLTGILLAELSPIYLWAWQVAWFSDGGLTVLLPHFETIGVLVSLAVAAVGVGLAGGAFRRVDL